MKKNPPNIESVDKERHGKLRVKPNPDFAHAKELNLAAISLGELSATVANFPVVFITAPDSNRLRPMALFGLRPGENVYYGAESWATTYHPLVVQRHPFVIGWDEKADDDKTLTACLLRNSPFLSEEEGIALFTPEGEQTDFLRSHYQLLLEILEGEKFTERFMQKVQAMGLLVPFEVLIQSENGEGRKLTGMHTIDERKMKQLTPEQVQELHASDFLAPCYLILSSLFQLHKLMRLRHDKGVERIAGYRIEYVDAAPAAAAVQ